MNHTSHTKSLSVLGVLLLGFVVGCGSSKPPTASITAAPPATPAMKAAQAWLMGGWHGVVQIDREAVNRTEGLTDAHIAGIEAAKMQFHFQDKGQVAMSASVPTPKGPAARNAMATWTVTKVEDSNVTLLIDHKGKQPTEQVVISRVDPNTFTLPAPQNFGVVRFTRVR